MAYMEQIFFSSHSQLDLSFILAFRCNGYVKAWKRLTVHQAPNILTIALKRFQSGRFGKLNKRVTFPEELDLSTYMSEDGDGTNLYSLYAVVVHVDMLNASFFGHYICYTKDYYGRWYRIDDCKVTIVDVDEVLSQGTYMLLYSRRTARQEPFVKPIEPARKKHLASKENDSIVPNGENVSSDTTSFPSSTGLESNCDLQSLSNTSSESNISLLRDTGHDRLTDIKTDGLTGKEDLELKVPVEITPMLVQKDSSDMDMNDSEISSSGPKVFEVENSCQPSHIKKDDMPTLEHQGLESDEPKSSEGDSLCLHSHTHRVVAAFQNAVNFCSPATQSSDEVRDMECDESFGISNTNSHVEDNRSVCNTEEVPQLSGDILEPIKLEYCPLGTTNGVEKLTNISRENGTKTSTVVSENGLRGKPKPLFSRGFLDKPIGGKSLTHEKRNLREKFKVPSHNIANGYANGKSELTNGAYVANAPAEFALNSDAACSNENSTTSTADKEKGSSVSNKEAASRSEDKNKKLSKLINGTSSQNGHDRFESVTVNTAIASSSFVGVLIDCDKYAIKDEDLLL